MLCRCDEVLSSHPVVVLGPVGNISFLNHIVDTNKQSDTKNSGLLSGVKQKIFQNRLYYAPWYPVTRASGKRQYALDMFESLLAMGCGHRRISLKAGETLVVDPGRWIHGCDRLPE